MYICGFYLVTIVVGTPSQVVLVLVLVPLEQRWNLNLDCPNSLNCPNFQDRPSYQDFQDCPNLSQDYLKHQDFLNRDYLNQDWQEHLIEQPLLLYWQLHFVDVVIGPRLEEKFSVILLFKMCQRDSHTI